MILILMDPISITPSQVPVSDRPKKFQVDKSSQPETPYMNKQNIKDMKDLRNRRGSWAEVACVFNANLC